MSRGAKVAIAVLAVYTIAIAATVIVIDRARAATEVEVQRLARLGDNASSDLRALPIDLPPLRETCRGVLHAGPPESLLSYAAPYPVELDVTTATDDLTQPHVYLPRRRFEGMTSYGLDSALAAEAPYGSFFSTLSDVAFEPPWSWGKLVERRGHRSLRVDHARYLVVSVVRVVIPPHLIDDKRFSGGAALFVARVLDAKSGDALCEGTLEAQMASSVVARQVSYGNRGVDAITMRGIASPEALETAFSRGLESGPLAAVCEAGGKATCDATAESVAPTRQPDDPH